MNIKLTHIVVLLLLMAVIHFTAIPLGLYQGRIWIDMPLHVMGGVLFSMLGLWLFQKYLEGANKFLRIFTIFSFALLGSFLWEIFEFSWWKFLPQSALSLKFYSLTVSDLLSDMFLGLVGGIFISYFYGRQPNV